MAKVAVLVENIYEEMELWYPYYRLKEEGFDVELIGSEKAKEYKGKYGYPAISQRASSHHSQRLCCRHHPGRLCARLDEKNTSHLGFCQGDGQAQENHCSHMSWRVDVGIML